MASRPLTPEEVAMLDKHQAMYGHGFWYVSGGKCGRCIKAREARAKDRRRAGRRADPTRVSPALTQADTDESP